MRRVRMQPRALAINMKRYIAVRLFFCGWIQSCARCTCRARGRRRKPKPEAARPRRTLNKVDALLCVLMLL
ncbi:MAG: hypothetical protein WBK20_06580 [Spirochaetota bacterium]